jgi:hypothetical protein
VRRTPRPSRSLTSSWRRRSAKCRAAPSTVRSRSPSRAAASGVWSFPPECPTPKAPNHHHQHPAYATQPPLGRGTDGIGADSVYYLATPSQPILAEWVASIRAAMPSDEEAKALAEADAEPVLMCGYLNKMGGARKVRPPPQPSRPPVATWRTLIVSLLWIHTGSRGASAGSFSAASTSATTRGPRYGRVGSVVCMWRWRLTCPRAHAHTGRGGAGLDQPGPAR